MIKAVIFDFDGVLENTYEAHFALAKKEIRNLTRDEHRKLFEGNVLLETNKMENRLTDFDFRKHFSKHKRTLKTKKEVRQCLETLSKKYMLGINSSDSERNLQDYLRRNKLTELFSFVYGRETHVEKTEKFFLAMKKYNLKAKDIVFVSDTLGDILAARKSGIDTIAVDFGFHERERLMKGNPVAIVSHFKDIIPVVDEISKNRA